VTSSPQALDLSFLAGLNPDLYHSIGHSLGILSDNGKLLNLSPCVAVKKNFTDYILPLMPFAFVYVIFAAECRQHNQSRYIVLYSVTTAYVTPKTL